MKVLIIEDNSEVAETVTLCLQINWPEAEISVAVEGIRGIEALRNAPFDIVMLDINLPDIDGFGVLKEIRSFSDIPIVILTVRGNEEDMTRGLAMGANDYIVKPFRPKELVTRVSNLLHQIADNNT